MTHNDKEHCCLCLEKFSDRPTQQVLLKCLNSLIESGKIKKILIVYLKTLKQFDKVLYIHKDCKRKFADTRRQSTMPVLAKKTPFVLTVTFY